MVMTHKMKGKFQPKWEGPFVVELVYSNGAYHLTTPEDDTLMMSINDRFLKKYHPWKHSSHDQVSTTPWLMFLDPKCLEEHQRRASSFNGSHHGRSMPSRLNIVNITMHDVNVEQTKCETLVLACHSSLVHLHYIRRLWRLKDRRSSWHLSPIENPQ